MNIDTFLEDERQPVLPVKKIKLHPKCNVIDQHQEQFRSFNLRYHN